MKTDDLIIALEIIRDEKCSLGEVETIDSTIKVLRNLHEKITNLRQLIEIEKDDEFKAKVAGFSLGILEELLT